MWPLRVASSTACSAIAMTWWCVTEVSRHTPRPGHLQQGMHIDVGLPCSIIQLKITIGIGQNGCCGAQMLQFIKRPLAPIVPGDGCPLLTCIFARHQFMQGLGCLHELGDKSVIVPSESMKAPDLSDGGGGGPSLIASIFHLSVTIPWLEMMCPRYNVPAE